MAAVGGPPGGDGEDWRTGHQRSEILRNENKKARTINDPHGDYMKTLFMRWVTINYEKRMADPMEANRPPPVTLPEWVQGKYGVVTAETIELLHEDTHHHMNLPIIDLNYSPESDNTAYITVNTGNLYWNEQTYGIGGNFAERIDK